MMPFHISLSPFTKNSRIPAGSGVFDHEHCLFTSCSLCPKNLLACANWSQREEASDFSRGGIVVSNALHRTNPAGDPVSCQSSKARSEWNNVSLKRMMSCFIVFSNVFQLPMSHAALRPRQVEQQNPTKLARPKGGDDELVLGHLWGGSTD